MGLEVEMLGGRWCREGSPAQLTLPGHLGYHVHVAEMHHTLVLFTFLSLPLRISTVSMFVGYLVSVNDLFISLAYFSIGLFCFLLIVGRY